MSLREQLVQAKFRVVKIVDSVTEKDKSDTVPHSKAFNQVVRFYNAPTEGLSVVLLLDGTTKIIKTSVVENLEISCPMGLPKRVILETMNTIYYLDEVVTEVNYEEN